MEGRVVGGRDGVGGTWRERKRRGRGNKVYFGSNNIMFGFVISLAKGLEEPRHLSVATIVISVPLHGS